MFDWRIARCSVRLACLWLLTVNSHATEPSLSRSRPAIDYERDVAPILQGHCIRCHGAERTEAGLRLDRREAALAGGDSGRAIEPANGTGSLLIALVSGEDPSRIMPPEGDRLSEPQIDILRAWIDEGAVWPEYADVRRPAGADHWSFQPPGRNPPPTVRNTDWVRNPIDAFVLSRLEAEGVAPSPAADRGALLRRLSLDLLGLPPAPDVVAAFLADHQPDAYERAVDRLLASPHFGERWGRHWLDLARYGDSNGYDNDEPRPDAWRYRDWVIEAINADLPFDQFTIEQLAGDLLPEADWQQRLATGFHRNTPTNTEGGVDREEFRVKTVVDRVNTTGTVWMGLTVGCANCHSHKYDPISQREYFGLFAFFDNADEVEVDGADGAKAQVLAAAPVPRITRVHRRGDYRNAGDPVQPGVPAVLPALEAIAHGADQPPLTRLDLARWLSEPSHPLTARVAVNRTWRHLFGRGLVATVEDFGTQGDRPSHPELLDWLALRMIDGGWRQKDLIRLIVCSATYQQASSPRADLAGRDPENALLARQNRFRLEAEALRDGALAASGLLHRSIGGPSFYPDLPTRLAVGIRWPVSRGPERYRRGMYIFTQRALPYPMMAAFDAPDSHVTCTRRDRSTTPLQALTMLNDGLFFECAQALGRRIAAWPDHDDEARIERAFVQCLARRPDQVEAARLRFLVEEQRAIYTRERGATAAIVGPANLPDHVDQADAAAWIGVARVLLNLDEFMTRE
jgi:mono/diheme cytochrome c family protein